MCQSNWLTLFDPCVKSISPAEPTRTRFVSPQLTQPIDAGAFRLANADPAPILFPGTVDPYPLIEMKLSVLSQSASERGLAFLLIGGHAVIAHGHPRNTFDLDLVVPSARRWRNGACFVRTHRLHDSIVRATFPPIQSTGFLTLPLDLHGGRAKKRSTVLQAAAAGRPVSTGRNAHWFCLKHLLALKSHAIRQRARREGGEDVDDVIALVRINRVNVAEPEWREPLCKIVARRNCMKNSFDSKPPHRS